MGFFNFLRVHVDSYNVQGPHLGLISKYAGDVNFKIIMPQI